MDSSYIGDAVYLAPGAFIRKDPVFNCFSFLVGDENVGPRFTAHCAFCNTNKKQWNVTEMRIHVTGIKEGTTRVSFCDPRKSPLWVGSEMQTQSNKLDKICSMFNTQVSHQQLVDEAIYDVAIGCGYSFKSLSHPTWLNLINVEAKHGINCSNEMFIHMDIR